MAAWGGERQAGGYHAPNLRTIGPKAAYFRPKQRTKARNLSPNGYTQECAPGGCHGVASTPGKEISCPLPPPHVRETPPKSSIRLGGQGLS